MKQCKICGEYKDLDKFYFRKDSNTYRPECKNCNHAKRKDYQREYKRKHWRKFDLPAKYGLSVEEYKVMIKKQNNKCAICEKEFTSTPHVDHNHRTGKVRGLLCRECNLVLGYSYDNSNTLENAIEYLSKYDIPTIN